METLLELDTDLFLWLNEQHTVWLDVLMFWISGTKTWIPFYVLLIGILYWKFKKKTWGILIAIVLTIVLADGFTSKIMKPYFERLRPSHEVALEGKIHLVEGYRGGSFGFASSHAANSFGLATIFFLFFRRFSKHVLWLFLWAFIVSYSRIYLGVHYPLDILVGALVGILSALLSYTVYRRIEGVRSKK